MEQQQRLYFRYSIAELLTLFETQKGDAEILAQLQRELKCRTRPTAVALAAEVEQAIADLQEKKKGVTPNSTQAAFPPQAEQEDVEYIARPDDEPKGDGEVEDNPPQSAEEPKKSGNLVGRPSVSIRACGPLRDVPETYIAPFEETLKLNLRPEMELRFRYVVALRAHVEELRSRGGSQIVIAVRDGRRTSFEGGKSGYQFSFDADADNVFDGAGVLIATGRRTFPGKVVAVMLGERTILVETDEDLGEEIPAAELRIDNSAMLEQLAERLEKIGQTDSVPFNCTLAEAAMADGGIRIEAPALTPPPGNPLLGAQDKAARMALGWTVSYIWGPPGTGKTYTLTAIVNSLFQAKKRVLIVSNTNQAVDQVLCKLCDLFGDSDIVQKGGIVRIGRIADEDLKKKHSDKVTPAGIAERLGAALKQRKREIEEALQRDAAKLERLQRTETAFKLLDELRGRIAEVVLTSGKLEEEQRRLSVAITAELRQIDEAERGMKAWQAAGTLRRIVMPAIGTLTARKGAAERQLANLRNRWTEAGNRIKAAGEEVSSLRYQAQTPENEVRGLDRANVAKEISALEAARRPLTAELAEINRKLVELEESIIRNARVLGATLTKLFLSPKLFAAANTVIVDEASMGVAPALYHAAGMAEERVIVCGDFRQLPPIVSTRQKAIYDEIGRDIFHVSGISSKVRANHSVSTLVMLNEQRRMASPICEVISGPMYDGKLRSIPSVGGESMAPAPFSHAITFVDTYSLTPFVGFNDAGSRYNIVHAIVARNIALHLRDQKFTDFGVAVGYRAQSRLISRILKEHGADEVMVGTVHRFQGSEKGALILDLPEGEGDKVVGRFMQGESPDNEGPRLVNVAISRAKSHLIIVANRGFLDRKLPGNSRVREMLHLAQERATVIDAKEILGMRPVDWSRIPGFGGDIKIPEGKALFNQHDFGSALAVELSTARKSVVVFSGFITLARAVAWGDHFRRLIAGGVKIRCVTRSAMTNKADTPENTDAAIETLRGIGCVVDLRSSAHQKVVIIDERIVWVGSLNPLSYTPNTGELMVRVEGDETAKQIAEYLALPGYAREGKAFHEQENPQCERCGKSMVWVQRKTTGYFVCPSEDCGFTTDLRKMRARTTSGKRSEMPENGPSCPICGAKTRLKVGRNGPFYSCTRYPTCKGTARVLPPAVARFKR